MNAKLTAKELIMIYQSVSLKKDFIAKASLVNGINAENIELAYNLINECYGILDTTGKEK